MWGLELSAFLTLFSQEHPEIQGFMCMTSPTFYNRGSKRKLLKEHRPHKSSSQVSSETSTISCIAQAGPGCGSEPRSAQTYGRCPDASGPHGARLGSAQAKPHPQSHSALRIPACTAISGPAPPRPRFPARRVPTVPCRPGFSTDPLQSLCHHPSQMRKLGRGGRGWDCGLSTSDGSFSPRCLWGMPANARCPGTHSRASGSPHSLDR